MKVCILSSSDGRGGAFAAAYRIHQSLISGGSESVMLVDRKTRNDQSVIGRVGIINKYVSKLKSHIDILLLKFNGLSSNNSLWSIDYLSFGNYKSLDKLNVDVINLHWINNYFFSIGDISKIDKPIVWTLHDMWPFTGGCHYSDGCLGYKNGCGNCPQFKIKKDNDLSSWIWGKKDKLWKDIDITIVTPSRWLADCARNSKLFSDKRIEVIPGCVDLNVFNPINKDIARRELKLPNNKLVLFGAAGATSNPRKGFIYLQRARKHLHRLDVKMIIFGADGGEDKKAIYLGRLNSDQSVALACSAADVFVAPSTEENLANTVVEALACGTPCVAFDIGGMSDMIEHKKNGYLAKPFNAQDLARGIIWVLENNVDGSLSRSARKKAEENFSPAVTAEKYRKLYEEIIG
jgi:glycosyltransferase involved in cell wall biosynthesis